MPKAILFLCPHNAAKSVIAAALFKRLAAHRGLDVVALSAGIEPGDQVSPVVVERMRTEGIDVSQHRPQRIMDATLGSADRILSMGCDVSQFISPGQAVEYWDDVPPLSKDPEGAFRAILARVESLVDSLVAGSEERPL